MNGNAFDGWARRHPLALLSVTMAAAIATTLLLLASTQGTIVLYQAF